MAGVLLLVAPDVARDCIVVDRSNAENAVRDAASADAAQTLRLAVGAGAPAGLVALLAASARAREGRPGRPTQVLAGLLLVVLAGVLVGTPDVLALPGLVLGALGVLAGVFWWVSVPLFGVVLALLAASDRFAAPGERSDLALGAALAVVLVLGLPGAATFAYERFEPVCLG